MVKQAKRKRHILIVLAVLILAAAIAFVFWFVTKPQTVDVNAGKPSFVFDEARAAGWWSGGNNWPNINDFIGDQITEAELPIADINVMKGTLEAPGECFVMAFYQKGSIDIESARNERINPTGANWTAIPTGTPEQTMQTPEGNKTYTFYQYDFSTPDGDDIQRGNAFGFIPLTNGYIEVRSICPTAELLPTTHSALSAISLNP